jgi:Ankyrin repeats (3 copies)
MIQPPNIAILVTAAFTIMMLSHCKEASVASIEQSPEMTAGERYWLLRKACESGDEIGVKILLRLGADADGYNDYRKYRDGGFTEEAGRGVEPSWPINIAAWNGNKHIVKILIDAGAEVDSFEGEGNTALINAAYKGHMEIVKMLLEAGADPTLKGVNGWTPADAAREGRHDDIYSLLRELTKSPDNAPSEYGTKW